MRRRRGVGEAAEAPGKVRVPLAQAEAFAAAAALLAPVCARLDHVYLQQDCDADGTVLQVGYHRCCDRHFDEWRVG